jgi:branched-chain amino acid aminotransferase
MSPFAHAVLDGRVVPREAAVVPADDEGFLRGDGVFEVVRLYDGVPFALDAHLTRMAGSAEILRLPFDAALVAQDVATLLEAAGAVDAAMRLVVTRGGLRLAVVEPLKARPSALRLATVTYVPTRILDGAKTLSYGANMLATRIAQERGADDALLTTPHGRILEAPTCSFFYVLGGQLHTPPLEDHILDSITRRHVLAVTGGTERITTTDDLPLVSEAFLASTLREVHPIAAIDGRPLAVPGPDTTRIAAEVSAHIRGEL